MKGYQKFNLFVAVLMIIGIVVAAAPDDELAVVPPEAPIVQPQIMVDVPIFSNESQYHDLIIKEYYTLRRIRANDPDKLTVRPMSLPEIQSLRARVSLLSELGNQKLFLGINISNDVVVIAYDLEDLLFAYIHEDEKEIKKWEAKFDSAAACAAKPKSCEKFRRRISKETEEEVRKWLE
jgi:hypothetical protein